MTRVLGLFIGLAGVGFVLSAVLHVAALFGLTPLGASAYVLHIGIFVVWVPAVFAVRRHTTSPFWWPSALRASPGWMQAGVLVVFAYAFVNFSVLAASNVGQRHLGEPVLLRMFSGHWMVFYGIAFVALFSARRLEQSHSPR